MGKAVPKLASKADRPGEGVMPALVAGIHVSLRSTSTKEDVDGRDIGERSDAVLTNGFARP
jgi:hypothetical protein